MRAPRTRVRAKRRAFRRSRSSRRVSRRVASPRRRRTASIRRPVVSTDPLSRVIASRIALPPPLAPPSPPSPSLARVSSRAVGTTDRSFDSRRPATSTETPTTTRSRSNSTRDERRRLLASAPRRGPRARASRTPSPSRPVTRPRVSRPVVGPVVDGRGVYRCLDTVHASFSTCVRQSVPVRPSRSFFTFSMCVCVTRTLGRANPNRRVRAWASRGIPEPYTIPSASVPNERHPRVCRCNCISIRWTTDPRIGDARDDGVRRTSDGDAR